MGWEKDVKSMCDPWRWDWEGRKERAIGMTEFDGAEEGKICT